MEGVRSSRMSPEGARRGGGTPSQEPVASTRGARGSTSQRGSAAEPAAGEVSPRPPRESEEQEPNEFDLDLVLNDWLRQQAREAEAAAQDQMDE